MQFNYTHFDYICWKFENDLTNINGDMSTFICAHLEVLLSVFAANDFSRRHFSDAFYLRFKG